MTDLEKIVQKGFLKENEEIYLHFGENYFVGRVKESGKIIETKLGKFNSPSPAAGTLLALIDNGRSKRHPRKIKGQEEVVCNGWNYWKTWNGLKLEELRKKLNE